jgi:hypothetical protein
VHGGCLVCRKVMSLDHICELFYKLLFGVGLIVMLVQAKANSDGQFSLSALRL